MTGIVTLTLPPAGVFSDAHDGHGFVTHNKEDKRILEFAIANSFRVCNTWFKERDMHIWLHAAPAATQSS